MIRGKYLYKVGQPFFQGRGYWATLWTQRGSFVQFETKALSIELRLFWRGCSPSSDCLSCSNSGLEPLWYLFTYNFSICGQVYSCKWVQISLHFEELLCKNVFLLLFLYVSHSVVEGDRTARTCVYVNTTNWLLLDLKRIENIVC